MKLYVIKDMVAIETGPIFEAVNDGVAMRNFRQLVEQKGVRREEFRLYYVGDYDHSMMLGRMLEEPCEVPFGAEVVERGDL